MNTFARRSARQHHGNGCEECVDTDVTSADENFFLHQRKNKYIEKRVSCS